MRVLPSECNPNQSSAITRCNIKTKNVKKDSSNSSSSKPAITTDAVSLVIASCTVLHDDPYKQGSKDPVPCCDGLEMKLKDWDDDGKFRYQCEQSSAVCTVLHGDPYNQPPYTLTKPFFLPCCEGLTFVGYWGDGNTWQYHCEPSRCSSLHVDPYFTGSLIPCCLDLYTDKQAWDGPDKKWRFQCERKTTPTPVATPAPVGAPTTDDDVYSNECCTTGIGCTKNDNCCPFFGSLCNWNKDTGCCDGMCNYPVGTKRCNPWITTTAPTYTCIPAGKYGKFSGTSETTKAGLTHSFETCYKFENDGTNFCYTQSWADGLGYYYQCLPNHPYEAFTYNVPWCGTPCQELQPAFKECVVQDQICVYDSDCCNDSECNINSGWPWNRVTLCSKTQAECEAAGLCWWSVGNGDFQCDDCYII